MPKLRGYFKGETDYFIDGYRVSNEIADSELYIYKKMAFYDYFVKRIDMPDFWKKYLFEAQEVDKEIEKKFEEYIIENIGL